jgi:ABC-type Fe3+-hydroxamate transport system substrate-binding protein
MIFKDQLNREVELKGTPKRIISLVPSQTELLFELGLSEEVIGITKFCIHPDEWFNSKTRVGGTKKLNLELIRSIQPDLIIGNKEENEQMQIETLQEEFPVWMSDVRNLNDALEMITQVGLLVGKGEESVRIKDEIFNAFQTLNSQLSIFISQRVAYFIWSNPMMSVGGDTFVHDMLRRCGLNNVFDDTKRYPEITPKWLQTTHPDLILLSSEPYPFKEKHIEEFKAICPESKIVLVDGEMFSWYGSRLLKASEYFLQLLKEFNAKKHSYNLN